MATPAVVAAPPMVFKRHPGAGRGPIRRVAVAVHQAPLHSDQGAVATLHGNETQFFHGPCRPTSGGRYHQRPGPHPGAAAARCRAGGGE